MMIMPIIGGDDKSPPLGRSSRTFWRTSHVKHHVTDESLERFVLYELFVSLRVFLEQTLHHLVERLIMRHARRVRRVRFGVLIGVISGNFVELRAPNYPGSTYTLVYDAKQDQLPGTYFHAALGQSFDVY
jgi:hypothetical protein